MALTHPRQGATDNKRQGTWALVEPPGRCRCEQVLGDCLSVRGDLVTAGHTIYDDNCVCGSIQFRLPRYPATRTEITAAAAIRSECSGRLHPTLSVLLAA
jgi:hypothetical protein